MKFQRLGKIFSPQDHDLFTTFHKFAQSPQAVVMVDRVRVFFTTREKDSESTFVSLPCYVDFDHSFSEILGIAKKPLILLGERGCFDEHGIFPFSPFPAGDKLYAYTTGWTRRASVSTDSGIGLAISHDQGQSFEKYGQGPVLGPSTHEPFLVSDGFVLRHEGKYQMWYIYGQRWITERPGAVPDRVYKIAHAQSNDAINWTRSGTTVILDTINQDECQALPTVVKYANQFLMAYCYRHATGFRTDPARGYRLGCAISPDLKNWTITDFEFVGSSADDNWDADMQCYPNLFEIQGEIFLLYNGNEFGKHGFGLARLST